MTLGEGIFCGSVAGLVNCLVVTPVELVKCRLQIQAETKKQAYYKGILDCLFKTYKLEGIKGLYKGNIATIFRDIPAYAGQFGGYHFGKVLLCKIRGKKMDNLSLPELMISGSIGGYCCWQFSYPQDVVKTLLQTQKSQKYKKMFDGGFFYCAVEIKRNFGFLGFWRGYLPCTIRGLYANACLFGAYEQAKYLLSDFKYIKD